MRSEKEIVKKNKYKLPCKCLNCGNKWIELISFGSDVDEREASLWIDYEGKHVYCPDCDSSKTQKNLKELETEPRYSVAELEKISYFIAPHRDLSKLKGNLHDLNKLIKILKNKKKIQEILK